jgi:hypothetical protein
MQKKSLLISLGIVVIVILAILLFFLLKNTGSIAGKAVSSEETVCTDSDGTDAWATRGTVTVRESDGTTAIYTDSCEGTDTVDYVCEGNRAVKHLSTSKECLCQNGACIPVQCSDNECNPSNTRQICSQGKWIDCGGDAVCYANVCVTPSKANAKIIGGGSSGDSGGGASTGTTTTTQTTTTPETTRSIGTIEGAITEDITINEKIVFIAENSEHNLKVNELATISMSALLDGNSFSLEVGGEKRTDFDGDGSDDLSIILKSINIATKKAKVLITVL